MGRPSPTSNFGGPSAQSLQVSVHGLEVDSNLIVNVQKSPLFPLSRFKKSEIELFLKAF